MDTETRLDGNGQPFQVPRGNIKERKGPKRRKPTNITPKKKKRK